MSLPPQRIAVKRRRDEEPVDALCSYLRLIPCLVWRLTGTDIPYKKTKQTLVWNRISNDDLKNVKDHAPSLNRSQHTDAILQPQIPTVRITLPEDDFVKPRAHRISSLQPTSLNRPTENATSQAREESKFGSSPINTRYPPVPRTAKEPRKFHFTPTNTDPRSPYLRYSSVRHGSVQKTKKKQNKDFAVFAERTYKIEKSKTRGASGASITQTGNDPARDTAKPSDEPFTPRKRPLASPAERKWRAQTWKQPPSSTAEAIPDRAGSQIKAPAMDEDSDASLGLAHVLQQFALDETRAAAQQPYTIPKSGLKFQPKPPKPRLAKEEADRPNPTDKVHKDAMIIDDNGEDANSFIIDVYVREAEHLAVRSSSSLSNTSLEKMDPDKVGLLVIEDEDQELWELYGEDDQSSDTYWNSEEEDENAEDYYGNDYPEEELDSDDEYDRNTYRHWQSAFEEEKLDGNTDWSGDESQAKNTWKFCRVARFCDARP
ncbi:MAG: hypothetical protein Q9209_000408 [Squamulea sp. 1 TL-2023]